MKTAAWFMVIAGFGLPIGAVIVHIVREVRETFTWADFQGCLFEVILPLLFILSFVVGLLGLGLLSEVYGGQ